MKIINNFLKFSLLIAFLFTTTYGFSAPKLTADDGKYYALIIAIDNYSGDEWTSLSASVSTAKSLQSTLENKYNFDGVMTLFNEDATRQNIIATIDRVAQQLSKDDNLLLFYSGHGMVIGNEGYWVPSEATSKERTELIANSEIKNVLDISKARHILALMDGTFAGNTFKSSNLFMPNDGSDNYYNKVRGLTSRLAITCGCESSEEQTDSDNQQSTFSKYLLKYLNENDKAYFDAGELYGELRMPVDANASNEPLLGHIQNSGHEGGQFVFVQKDKLPEEGEYQCTLTTKIEEGTNILFEHGKNKLNAKVNAPNVKYQWYIDDNIIIGERTSSLTVKKTAIYKVIVENIADGCIVEKKVNVTVKPPKVIADVYIDEGSSVQFTLEGKLTANSNVEGVVFEWRKDGFFIGGEKEISVFEAGTYTVKIRSKTGETLATAHADVEINKRTYKARQGYDLDRIANLFYGDPNKKTLIIQANPDLINADGSIDVGVNLVIPSDTEQQYTAVAKTLQVVGAEGFAPFSSPNAYRKGMLAEIVETTFKNSNKDIRLSFENHHNDRAETGEFDIAFPVAKNEKDERDMYFSVPIYRVLNVLFVQKGMAASYDKVSKFKGKTIATLVDYTIDPLERMKNEGLINIRRCSSIQECFELLESGDVDMIATSQMIGWSAIKKLDGFSMTDFEVLPQALEKNTMHVAISKKHPYGQAIIAQFNEKYLSLKDKGIIETIEDRHISEFQKE